MEVTREVIIDLLPVYLAGDASAPTRQLVEEFLANNPELAKVVRLSGSPRLAHAIPSPPDRQKVDLDRVRQLIRRKTWYLASAVFFTLVVFSLEWTADGLRFLMWGQKPLGLVYLMLALVCWAGYFVARKRLRVSGL